MSKWSYDGAWTEVSQSVLFSVDLWPGLWPGLDRGSKRALRANCVAMRKQVDISVTVVVASPDVGFIPDELSRALLRWPGVSVLALLSVSGASSLAPLATASLAVLKSLTVRERVPLPGPPVAPASAWGLLELSSTVAATLQVLDISCCVGITSIDAVRSCVQLRCLRMAGGVGVSDLSPLAACSQLEEVWMAGHLQVASLAPLKACPKLRKLDLRDGGSLLQGQVGDLQLACDQLAHPSSVVLEGLVHELQPRVSPCVQVVASRTLDRMAFATSANRAAIVAAGAISPLVQLLGQHTPAGVQMAATDALKQLAVNHAENQSVIAGAGAIPPLVKLLERRSPAGV
ncbi:hypothetical protein FOA52_012005 [Chlamydomonas sp. UWO 241]|nr:hypothetical protein FOA52_012005 [Chlamydomonas sp. UWO 241]